MRKLQRTGYLVLETGEVFEGVWRGGDYIGRAGEVVFNTSHSGYEEIATDPSYYSQIMVMTMPQQGNYSVDRNVWESRRLWIDGFVCLDLQESERDHGWKNRLIENQIPVLSGVDTRKLVLRLRDQGTPWGAIVEALNREEAIAKANELIAAKKKIDPDWVWAVSRKEIETYTGEKATGPVVGVLDFGVKQNTIRELQKFSSKVIVFPSRTTAEEILRNNVKGVMLSNGPGDPSQVQVAVKTVKDLIGKLPIFGICMGHQILSLALGAKTYRLKFGHRGSNHPVKDELLNLIYMTSQNHGYAVDTSSLPEGVKATHINLNDNTVEGISCSTKFCWSVQFHPESHPGPREARTLFDYFERQVSC